MFVLEDLRQPAYVGHFRTVALLTEELQDGSAFAGPAEDIQVFGIAGNAGIIAKRKAATDQEFPAGLVELGEGLPVEGVSIFVDIFGKDHRSNNKKIVPGP